VTLAPAPQARVLRIVEGDVETSDRPDLAIATVVGSCVAACLWDPLRGAGGMNHFLLPGTPGEVAPARRHGVHLMELLINRLMGIGADRRRLQAKVFGGASLRAGLTDAGARNAEFVRAFLAHEGIPLVGGALGGPAGRAVVFWPASGRARLKTIALAQADAPALRRVPPPPPPGPPPGEPEFF